MNVLVTGGAGFIGSNLVAALLQRGDRVRVLDNFSTGRKENLQEFGTSAEVKEGDVRDLPSVRAAVEGMDVILHQAALPSVPRSVKDPLSSNEVNVNGTLHVLTAAKDAGVKRIVFASSSSVYGDTPELPKHEGLPTNPLSPYAVTKLAGETYCRVFSNIYGMEAVALRYFNVFGPKQDPTSQYSAVIPKFITAMMNGQRPVIFGDGEQSRDFTFVANVIHANLLAATVPNAGGHYMNCACHGRITLNQLVAEINTLLGTSIAPEYRTERPGDIKHSFAAIEKAKSVIGFEPKVSFTEGLRRTVEWYRQHPLSA